MLDPTGPFPQFVTGEDYADALAEAARLREERDAALYLLNGHAERTFTIEEAVAIYRASKPAEGTA
jgi:hypothetical protein